VNCEDIDVRLAEGTATVDEEVASHLAACGDCRKLWPLFPTVANEVYTLGPVIGQGGMGRIRTAIDRRLGRKVALKELLFHTDRLAARFVREARVAAALQHPNIIPIYDVGCWGDGTPFYTMRLVEGRTLSAVLDDTHTLDARMALLPAIIAAADAVGFAHAQGVVHRDLTPGNILLGDYGETIVIDWGLAKDLRPGASAIAPEFRTGVTHQVLTVTGDVIGSPAYMPREQAAGEATDERSDVYALGAILYHVLAGQPPYEGRSSKAVLAKVRSNEPVAIEKRALGAPRGLLAIVKRAMARDPNLRFANGKQLALELRRFQANLVVDAHRSRLFSWLG
jgi:eukaryotic-like serine/threonine-protein kinase